MSGLGDSGPSFPYGAADTPAGQGSGPIHDIVYALGYTIMLKECEL